MNRRSGAFAVNSFCLEKSNPGLTYVNPGLGNKNQD